MKEQKVYRGEGSLEKLLRDERLCRAGSVLLVTGYHTPAPELIERFSVSCTVAPQRLTAPTGNLEVVQIPTGIKADVVIAIGGGRVMDFAKGVIYVNEIQPLFIAAPTTAGSGSEATSFAVFYEEGKKISLQREKLLPDEVVLDPLLLLHLPAHLKAISAADSLAQCIESLWNRNRTAESERYALQALDTIVSKLPAYIQHGDAGTCAEMLSASYMAGKAISITKTTGPHALSYYLTFRHNVPHGQAVAVFLPVFFLYNQQVNVDAMNIIYKALGVEDAEQAFQFCNRLLKTAGLAVNLRELGLAEVNTSELLQSVNHERFDNNPRPFDAAALDQLIRRHLI